MTYQETIFWFQKTHSSQKKNLIKKARVLKKHSIKQVNISPENPNFSDNREIRLQTKAGKESFNSISVF